MTNEHMKHLYATDDPDLAKARRWLEQTDLTEQERRFGSRSGYWQK